MMSKSYTGKLDLTYKKGDTELKKDSDIDVTKGEVKKDYQVPKVADTEDNYTLKIIANYGKTKEKTRVLAEATVWPKKVKLTVKDAKDNSVCKNLAYSIVHTKGSATKGNTDDNGVGNEDLKKCPYSIKLKAPWETSTSKNDTKKREWEITAARNDQAKFLRPDITTDLYTAATGTDKSAGVRQYVNATSADEGCDGKGNIVEFEVCCKHQPSGSKGDKIYIKVEFTKLGKRNDPLPALLAPALDIKTADAGKTFTGYTQLDADGGTGKFKLQLGLAGAETFTVSCGYSKGDPSDDKLKLVTWRQLTYQSAVPDSDAGPNDAEDARGRDYLLRHSGRHHERCEDQAECRVRGVRQYQIARIHSRDDGAVHDDQRLSGRFHRYDAGLCDRRRPGVARRGACLRRGGGRPRDHHHSLRRRAR